MMFFLFIFKFYKKKFGPNVCMGGIGPGILIAKQSLLRRYPEPTTRGRPRQLDGII